MTMMLTSTNQADIIAANAQIEINSGIPTPDGKTTKWSTPKKAYQQDFWFIKMPPPEGWNGISQKEMMQNVVDVVQIAFNSNWYPPIVPPVLSEDKPRVRLQNA